VRLLDLAVVQIDLPYLLGTNAPWFAFFGRVSALSEISIFNIVVGPPDPSNFDIPPGACLQMWNESIVDHAKAQSPLELFTAPLKEMYKGLKRFHKRSSTPQEPFKKRKSQQTTEHPPPLNQTFTANWQLIAANPEAPFTPYTFGGKLGFDFTVSGFHISLDTITGNVPINLQTEFRIYPDLNGIEFLQFGPDGSCYSYIFFQYIFSYLLPVFQVPYDSNFVGNVTINGDASTAWQTTWQWKTYFAQLYIRDRDAVLIQALVPDPFSETPSPLIFSDFTGTVPPSSYARSAQCAPLLNWNHNFNSHLPWAWCFPWC
jgi:hypothetical protein